MVGGSFAVGATLVVCVALPIGATGANGDGCPSSSTTTTTTTTPSDCPPASTETTPTSPAPPPAQPNPSPAPPPPATTPAQQPPPPVEPPVRKKECPPGWRTIRPAGGGSRRCVRPRRARPRRRNAARRTEGERRQPARKRAKPRPRRGAGRRLVPITSLVRGPLPDPLPPGKRLDRGFARLLQRISREQRTGWPLVLAVLRAEGATGAAPAGADRVRQVAAEAAAGALHPSERVRALADYNWAVGLDGLTRGLDAVKRQLGDRVLNDPSINLYPGGWGDIQRGRVDVRVLVTMLYLAHRHDGITVSCLITGHSLLTKSGNFSLHPAGRAVDIAAVGGVPVLGHQQPGGVTEGALRSVLLLPRELQPSELISLFELGGPSFAMADHADHIHVGF